MREENVTTDALVRVVRPSAKECTQLLETEEARNRLSPWNLQKEPAQLLTHDFSLLRLILDLWPPEL